MSDTDARSRRGRRVFALVVFAGLAATLFVAYTPVPAPPCLFRLIWRIPCPGCGMERALEALWHGDLHTSLRYHPLAIPFALFILTLLLSALWPERWARSRRLMDRVWDLLPSRAVMIPALIIFVGTWLLRLVLWAMGDDTFMW